MTRKDYTAIAAMLWAQKEDALLLTDTPGKSRIMQHARHATWCRIVQATADLCAAGSPRFDRARFLAAAGLVAE